LNGEKICIYCKKLLVNKQFGLTLVCDKCYRKNYNKTVANYRASGHKYPWTIDGRLKK